MNTRIIIYIFALAAPVSLYAQGPLPAFPGAEGGGAVSQGGRGGVICNVTNLNDSGSGSLRACINASGPRTVIFRVAGTIELQSAMPINNPYLTIAGQSAPGGGIQLSGASVGGWDEMLRVNTHNVVVSHLRIRKGRTNQTNPPRATTTSVGFSGKNVIFDHLSIYWSEQMNFGVYAHDWGGQSRENAPKNVTLSNSILAEPIGLNAHVQVGVGAPAKKADWMMGMTDIDFHNNLLFSSSHRNPTNSARSGRLINNIIYNYGFYGTQVASGLQYDIIGNLYKAGPENRSGTQPEVTAFVYSSSCDNFIDLPPSIHIAGNKGPSLANPDADNWTMVTQVSCMNGKVVGALPTAYRRTRPLETLLSPITVRHVNDLEKHVLPKVGASRRLDCLGNWVDNRDAQDNRVIDWYKTNRGGKIDHEMEVGGFPVIAGGVPCKDSDGDGMPDEWEVVMGLNPNDPSDRNKLHPSGHTMLESYLFGPSVANESLPPTAPQGVRVD